MVKNPIGKCLTVLIILLFIGVTIAPSINQSVVKASQDPDLVEVTTQACGIKGYGDTTVKLTREQYQDLEQYLVEFRARLNQTSTREEVVPIFKEAVVELNKYGLLPKGMSIKTAQNLVLGIYQYPRLLRLLDSIQNKVFGANYSDYENYNCLISGQTTNTLFVGPVLGLAEFLSFYLCVILLFISQNYDSIVKVFLDGLRLFFIAIFLLSSFVNVLDNYNPIPVLSMIGFGSFIDTDIGAIEYPAKGWIHTFGLHGEKNWSGDMFGNLNIAFYDRPFYYYMILLFIVHLFYPGALGFSGIKTGTIFSSSFYIGHAFMVKITSDYPPVEKQ